MTKKNTTNSEEKPFVLKKGNWLDPVLEPFSTQEDLDQLDKRIAELKQEQESTKAR